MAAASLQPGFAPANTSRRSVLSAMLTAPVAAIAIAPGAQAAQSVHADTAAWDRALAAFEAAERQSEQYRQNHYRPVAAELYRRAPFPDLWFDVTARNGQVARFDMWPHRLHDYDDHPSRVFREKAAAVRAAWQKHVAVQEQLNYPAICDELERLAALETDCETAVIETPAPHLAALWWKLDRLFGIDHSGCSDSSMDTVLADAKRLCLSRSMA